MQKYNFKITREESEFPLKTTIKKKYRFSSRLMTKIKFQNLIKLNGVAVPGWVVPSEGDTVSVDLPDESSHFPAEDIPIEPVYEDDDLLIINKQAGVTVHPTKGHPDHTIANGIMNYMNKTGSFFKVRFINRLDMDTSGILVIGKNSHAQAELNKQMMAGTTKKEYIAVAQGIITEDDFLIDAPIGRPSPDSVARGVISEADGGYPSKTHVRVLERFASSTLVSLDLLTGRTHQIRVHLSHIGHPLLGDRLYGGDQSLFPDRQALHACSYEFDHPVTKKRLKAEARIPDDISDLINTLRSESR